MQTILIMSNSWTKKLRVQQIQYAIVSLKCNLKLGLVVCNLIILYRAARETPDVSPHVTTASQLPCPTEHGSLSRGHECVTVVQPLIKHSQLQK